MREGDGERGNGLFMVLVVCIVLVMERETTARILGEVAEEAVSGWVGDEKEMRQVKDTGDYIEIRGLV